MQQLSGLDASFLYFETPRTPGHVFNVSIYDPSTAPGGVVTFTDVVEHFRSRLHVSPMFRRKLVRVPFGLDHPYWIEDADFELEYHLRHMALPRPGDWRQLCVQVARLHSRPLDYGRPLWEATMIEGLDNIVDVPAGSFAIVDKLHHAAVDGVTVVEIRSAVHDLTPGADRSPVVREWSSEPEPSALTLLSRAAVHNAMRPGHFARVVGRSVPTLGRIVRQVSRGDLQTPTLTAPRTRFNGRMSAHRVVDARRFDLHTIKRIKALVPSATVNDVGVALVGGCLRRYLSGKGELPDESLRVVMPVSVRTAEQTGSAGNQVAFMAATLGTDVDDPLKRLEVVRQSTHASKAFTQAVDARSMVELSELLPGGLAMLAARATNRFEMTSRGATPINTMVSNVPGPQVPIYLAGARMVTTFGGATVIDGMGLFHGISSYCGEMIMSVVSDRDLMPDPDVYGACLQASFDELAAAAVPRRKPRTRGKRPDRSSPADLPVRGGRGYATK